MTKITYLKGKAVIHFLSCLTEEEYSKCEDLAKQNGDTFAIDTKYNFAASKAKPYGGKRFHNKSYGGGIAFDSEQECKEFLNTIKK